VPSLCRCLPPPSSTPFPYTTLFRSPHARHEKEVPFEAAPFGVTGLETAFSALYTNLVEPGQLPLETLLERMSAGPARIFGLEQRSEEHTSELQSHLNLVCRLLLEKK